MKYHFYSCDCCILLRVARDKPRKAQTGKRERKESRESLAFDDVSDEFGFSSALRWLIPSLSASAKRNTLHDSLISTFDATKRFACSP